MLLAIISLSSCAEDKKSGEKKTGQEKQATAASVTTDDKPARKKGDKVASGFSILEQLHKDTVIKRVRLPRYDDNFTPLSLLYADTMEVINGETVEAQRISVELYNPDGSVKARTKMRRAIYREDTATLEAREAIYIRGPGFEASGSGLVYDTKTGRGFVLGPASTLFQIGQEAPAQKTKPRASN